MRMTAWPKQKTRSIAVACGVALLGFAILYFPSSDPVHRWNYELRAWMDQRCPNYVVGSWQVSQSSDGDYRTVVATDTIKENDIILKVPRSCFLVSSEIGIDSDIIKAVFDSKTKTISPPMDESVTRLSLYLLDNWNNPDHAFKAYFSSLPVTDWKFLTQNWSNDELADLVGTHVGEIHQNVLETSYHDYERVCVLASYFCDIYSWEDFRWANSMVLTRTYVCNDNRGEPASCMVPLADQFNHDARNNAAWKIESDGSFVIRAQQDIALGAEIMLSYGTKATSDLLGGYGFAPISNSGFQHNFDYVKVSLPDKQGEYSTFSVMYTASQSFATTDAFDYARKAVAKGDSEIMKANSCAVATVAGHHCFVSIRNEIATLTYLAQYARERLKAYSLPPTHVNRLLKDMDSLPTNKRHALLVVRSEQQVAQFWIDTAEIVLSLLEQAPENRIESLREMPNATDMDRYRQEYIAWLVEQIKE